MPVATYTLGPPTRPSITHDNGFLDVCTPREAGVTDYLTLGAWELAYRGADTVKAAKLADALAAYNHFLHGNGQDREFNYERYVASDSSGPLTLQSAIADAKEGAELLDAANFAASEARDFQMTGTAIACRGGSPRFPYPATENWQKAIGAHYIWLSADLAVWSVGPERNYAMELTLHAEDRYNFNPGAEDIQTGIADRWNGELECSGLAQQYTNYATLTRSVQWVRVGSPPPTSSSEQVTGQPRTRQRQPADRRTRL